MFACCWRPYACIFLSQGKQPTSTLKRKSDSNAPHDEEGPSPPRLQPVRELASALSANPSEAGVARNIFMVQVWEFFQTYISLKPFFFFFCPFLPSQDLGAPPPVSSPSSSVLSGSRGISQGDRAPPPQAVVKPSVLTHLIEGFVIQEGAEPFPVSSWDTWSIFT